MKEEKDNFDWCLLQTKGLRLTETNENLSKIYLRKSKGALNMLGSAIEKKEYEWILDTSYYAKYFAIYALFIKAGIKCEIHDCTIFALNILFAENRIVPFEIYEELKKSKEQRVGAIYYNKEFGLREIMIRANATPEFCMKVEKIIENISDDQITKIRENFIRLKNKR